MKKLFGLILICLFLQGCNCCFNLAWDAAMMLPYRGPALYYRVTGYTIEVMQEDSFNSNYYSKNQSFTIKDNKSVVFLVKFEIKPNKNKGRGDYPEAFFTKCSYEKMNSFSFKMIATDSSTLDLTSSLKGLDTSLTNSLDLLEVIDLEDFILKFNDCDWQFRRGGLWKHQLALKGTIPISKSGNYHLVTQLSFSDNRVITRELKLHGEVKP